MGSADEVDIVLFQELFDDGLSKSVRNTAVVLSPARLALFRVRPDQVTEEAILWHFCRPGDLLKLGDCDELWAETAMHTQDFVIDERSDRHAIEDILELFPHANRVAALALVVEAVDAVDLSTLVVTAQKEEVLLELDLICEEEDDSLKRVLSSVNIVAQEEVVSLRGEATILKQTEQVSELAMGVAYK